MITNLETTNSPKGKISRAYLYNLVADNIDFFDDFLQLKQNKKFIKQIFKDSAKFISFFEKDINNQNDFSYEEFLLLIANAIKIVEEDSFREFISSNLEELFYKKAKDEKITFKNIIKILIDNLVLYQNNLLEKNYVKKWNLSDSNFDSINMPQIFLSYAYVDKGLTLGLFFHFLLNGAFLYVNWMWCGAESNSSITKKELNKQLSKSKQLLFLRTTNSELNIHGGHHIRQWCSWEIGNFYSQHPGNKFYLNFYGYKSYNDLLSTFKIFHYISKGTMH